MKLRQNRRSSRASRWLLFLAPAFSVVAQNAVDAGAPSRTVRECASCHPAQAKPHPQTSMAHAMELPAECTILKAHPLLTFQNGGYSYRIERKGDESIYSVSDGRQTISVPLGWAFGLGKAGQTYVFEKDGILYESRVSFYSALNGLDWTLGAANVKPLTLLEAAGRSLDKGETNRCFGCHATKRAESQAAVTPHELSPGVQCERCHGSAEAHIDSFKGHGQTVRMKDLRSMSSEDTSNFCGQCHRTWSEIAGGGMLGIVNVRFQPYRLTGSQCYDPDDARIKCTACHDPHREVDMTDADYDVSCQRCHAGGKAEAHRCPKASAKCVSCHMPKLEMPGSHHQFTDHQIRVVRANAPYPN